VTHDEQFAKGLNAGGPGQRYAAGKFDNMLVLGFNVLFLGGPTPFNNAVAQNTLVFVVFVFYLGVEHNRKLTMGGYNENKSMGDITWIKLSEPNYWLLNVNDIAMGS